MNPHVQDWVNELRDPARRQTHGVMRKVDTETGEVVGECCLGVACDIAGVHFIESGYGTYSVF